MTVSIACCRRSIFSTASATTSGGLPVTGSRRLTAIDIILHRDFDLPLRLMHGKIALARLAPGKAFALNDQAQVAFT